MSRCVRQIETKRRGKSCLISSELQHSFAIKKNTAKKIKLSFTFPLEVQAMKRRQGQDRVTLCGNILDEAKRRSAADSIVEKFVGARIGELEKGMANFVMDDKRLLL